MIELPMGDRRLVALNNGSPILTLVQIQFSEAQGGFLHYSSSGNHIVKGGVSYIPHVLQSISDVKITSKIQPNEITIGLIDRDYQTPARSLYAKLQREGVIGTRVQVGVFFRDGAAGDPYTDTLWDTVGKIRRISRNGSLVSVVFSSFLDNIDNHQVCSMTKNSQRSADESDSSLDFVETARQHAFGGSSRD